MGQDIRELLKQDRQLPSDFLEEGHKARFLERLDEKLPVKKKKKSFFNYRIAASILVIVGLAFFGYQAQNKRFQETNAVEGLSDAKNATVVLDKEVSSLAKISPELEKTENYFLTSIKFELSNIKVTDDNRELVESFKERLKKLDDEYQNLNQELIELGVNVESIEAMIENLRLRLSLLNRLKEKLKELESLQNEYYTDIQA